MTTDQRHQQLDEAIARRDAAQASVQTLQGRLDAAEERVASVKKECQDRGVAPEKLVQAIHQLEQRYDTELAAFENDIAEAEAKLAPFEQEDQP